MNRLTLNLFFFALGIISTRTLAVDVPAVQDTPLFSHVLHTLKEEKLPIENIPIPNSPYSLTFRNDQIVIHEEGELFSTYDTKTPRFYVHGKPVIDKWQLINVLFETSSQTVYVHARLPMYDWPVLSMTKNSVTELYKEKNYTVWGMFMGADDYVYVHRSQWARDVNNETVQIISENEVTTG